VYHDAPLSHKIQTFFVHVYTASAVDTFTICSLMQCLDVMLLRYVTND